MNIYLACPYSHPCGEIRSLRFKVATVIAGHLMETGLTVFSPITHGHAIGLFSASIPGDWKFWKSHCQSFLAWAHVLKVVNIPEMGESIGVNAEIDLALQFGLTIEILDKDYCCSVLEAVKQGTLLSEDILEARLKA